MLKSYWPRCIGLDRVGDKGPAGIRLPVVFLPFVCVLIPVGERGEVTDCCDVGILDLLGCRKEPCSDEGGEVGDFMTGIRDPTGCCWCCC